jgi:hypothetical protein
VSQKKFRTNLERDLKFQFTIECTGERSTRKTPAPRRATMRTIIKVKNAIQSWPPKRSSSFNLKTFLYFSRDVRARPALRGFLPVSDFEKKKSPPLRFLKQRADRGCLATSYRRLLSQQNLRCSTSLTSEKLSTCRVSRDDHCLRQCVESTNDTRLRRRHSPRFMMTNKEMISARVSMCRINFMETR